MSTDSGPCLRVIDDDALDQAAQALRDGELVAFPTETVYGLGADATNDRAVARLFAIKGRPSFNPLIVHVPDISTLEPLVVLDQRARDVADAFWPGPLTLVLNRRADCPVSLLCSAGLDSLAVRVPGHSQARKLLAAADRPIAAPSANRSGRLSPTTAQHVAMAFADERLLILDGGACQVGLESSVLDLTGEQPALLRSGVVTEPDLKPIIGPISDAPKEGPISAPGQLASHYAPERPLRLDAEAVSGDEALIAFGPEPLAGAKITLNLSPSGDLEEAAANLFAYLHKADSSGASSIAAMPVPMSGLGRAINDRLVRAATPPD